MTSKNNLAPVASRPSGQKILVLLLAGVGILIALVLIGLGIYLWARTNQGAAVSTPAPTPTIVTATPAAEQPTPLPGVVIVVPTHTSTPTASPAAQSGDSVSSLPTVTRALENTPTPPALRPQQTRQVTVDGTIELIAPDDNIQIGDTVEFKWRWLENKGCAQPPEGYAFEIRVWRDNNAAGPRGAMDAKAQKQNISCDSASGIHSFTIGAIKTVPGFEGSTEGRFRWDVALVQLEPYEPKIFPPYRIFFTN